MALTAIDASTQPGGGNESNSNPPPKSKTDKENGEEPPSKQHPLYFSKNGKPQFGITPPTAFAFSYPHPPLPSNLTKNRVLRPLDEESKEHLQEGITDAEKEFEKEAMPLPGLSQIEGVPLPKGLISEIELALYWDRHPYEFRPAEGKSTAVNNSSAKPSAYSMRKSKSEMNLSSKVGEVLRESSSRGSFSKTSSVISEGENKSSRKSLKSSRSSGISSASSMKNLSYERELPAKTFRNNNQGERSTGSPAVGNHQEHINSANGNPITAGEKCSNNSNIKIGANKDNLSKSIQMSESEKKKFDDIKLFHQQGESSKHCLSHPHHQGQNNPPKLIRSHEQIEQIRKGKKSEGVQVSLEDVTAAALKSTYLCPLHGQYRNGVDRRSKSGFRTDMSSIPQAHAYCSRSLKGIPSRTKLIKTAETQTDDDLQIDKNFHTMEDSNRVKRSKTAGHTRCLGSKKGKDVMASEYHGSFKNPYKMADSEKRQLRNKILNYCFTKHSIF